MRVTFSAWKFLLEHETFIAIARMRINLISLPKQPSNKKNSITVQRKEITDSVTVCFTAIYCKGLKLCQKRIPLQLAVMNRLCKKLCHRPVLLKAYKTLLKTDSVTAQNKLCYTRKLKTEIRNFVTGYFAAIYCKSLKFC